MKTFTPAFVVLLWFALAAPLLAQQSAPESPSASVQQQQKPSPLGAPPKPADDAAPTFKVDVKLVNVFVTVTDQNGAPISTLKKDDFKLSEDGFQQNIAVFDRESQLPLSIILAIDTSLSTRKDLRLELDAARRFAQEIMRPVDRMSVYTFSEVVNEVVPFTPELRQIDRGISNIRNGSATALYDAIYLASNALANRQGRKVLVLITDGGDTVSKTDYQEALRTAQESEAIVYSIIIVPIESNAGRDIGGEHALIQMSHDTGGKYYYASSTDTLNQAFRQISDELRTQYLLAYYPSHRLAASDFRRIEIQVSADAGAAPLQARYRTGYYTSKPQ
jgi:Ca-activated chloride channel family protein